ncbi:hypothetical protein [Hymenobacter latericus]|uniref:hypothetical protein n=1 Tax=Hymenobacter sp. YIM 151858-1 TaxID=2987688 RepID=UPI002227113C|nr:hypothetical protein [Hymenobacter sp. YIM 151858-1]UYZ60021.1 hypothetical protein OIS50_04295 [Hymenobacter sp. YIM 151858-1]
MLSNPLPLFAYFPVKTPNFAAEKVNSSAKIQSSGPAQNSAAFSTTPSLSTAVASTCGCPLPLKHRVLIAMYALEIGRQSRDEILAANDVTEADLMQYQKEWLRMRRRRYSNVA